MAARPVHADDSCIGITAHGKALRFAADEVSEMGRAAFGVRVLNMTGDDLVIGIARQPKEEDELDEDIEQESVDQNAEVADVPDASQEADEQDLQTGDDPPEEDHDD